MGILSGLLKAIVDAIHGEDDRIAGQRVTQLTADLLDTDTEANVVSTIGFGEFRDGTGDARIVIDGEIIYASGRTDTSFTGLVRGVANTKVKARYPSYTLVSDWSRNTTALDIVRRGFLVRYAIGSDLDVIGRNLGLKRCSGWTDDIYRSFIEAVAYAPKQIIPTLHEALEVVLGVGNFEIVERNISEPFRIYVYVDLPLDNDLKGKFFLNGGEPLLSTGLLQVETTYPIVNSPLVPGPGSVGVFGVYDDTLLARRGVREGMTNYFTGGSFVDNVITLGSSPGPVGTPLLVDYNAFQAHYLPDPFTIEDDDDFYPYLSDAFLGLKCMADQIRAAGIQVIYRNKVTPPDT
jgi:hypothetical protein